MRPHALRATALAVLLALAASGCSLPGTGGGGGYKLIAYFDRAVSVYPTSDVRVLGLPGGKVDAVDVEGDHVKVTMTMNKDVPIPADVHAQIVPQSLIGERYIQLMPAWTNGDPRAEDGHVIEMKDTITPVEPDEALAALKKFLDSLDPEGVGRLINNAADALKGNGAELNSALNGVSQLVATFAAKDQALVDIVDNLDQFTATLRTRETQLGDILTTFSQATQVLADERGNIQRLLASIASLSNNGLALVSKHAGALRTDLATLGRLSKSIDTNLDSLGKLMDSGPLLVAGIHGAYNPTLRAINLRTSLTPLVNQILNPVLGILGLPALPCIPATVTCLTTSAAAAGAVAPQSATAPVATTIAPARTPIDDLLDLLGSPTVPPASGPGVGDRIAGATGSVGGFFGAAARAMVGAS